MGVVGFGGVLRGKNGVVGPVAVEEEDAAALGLGCACACVRDGVGCFGWDFRAGHFVGGVE